ncbi:MAG: hypothetical protein L6R40_000412 [Gallowayella cf. fulva]|nr:MAG: hypothetical protein L6R40_000412 [Xanthomendoza cf. fulva]
MRLRLTVQRHGLPPARVLWRIAAVRPPYTAAGSESTIAQLLEQINEIIPLESGDWGLEDYAVEVRGFECLHFSEVNQVLKEDDEDDEENFESQGQIVLHTGSGDEESSPSGTDESEDAAIASDDEQDLHAELDDIRNDNDLPRGADEGFISKEDGELALEGDSRRHGALTRRRPRKPQGLGLIASSLLADGKGTSYTEAYDNPLLDMFADDGTAGRVTSSPRTKLREPVLDSRHPRKRYSIITTTSHGYDSSEASDSNNDGVGVTEGALDTPATTRIDSSDDSEDDDFEPSDNAAIEEGESDKENATPGSPASTDIDVSISNITEAAELAAKIDSSFASESDTDVDETSSSSASSASDTSSSDSGRDDFQDARTEDEAEDQETSSSGTSSSSSTTSVSEQDQPQRPQSTAKQAVDASSFRDKRSDEHSHGHGDAPTSRVPVPPGAGLRHTQKRNQRRRDRKKLVRLQEAGKLPPDATTSDLREMEATLEGRPLEYQDQQELTQTGNKNEAAQFEEKRQALLRAISSGGVDLGDVLEANQIATVARNHTSSSSLDPGGGKRSVVKTATVEKSTSSSSEKTLIDTATEAVTEDPNYQRVERNIPDLMASQEDVQGGTAADASQSVPEDIAAASKPRMRLDMESSRRLLFGALGHRAPKTKEDEAVLQAKLMKNTQSPKRPPPQIAEDGNPSAISPSISDEHSNWKDKIELSAVECCHEGIELSTPPFPFVQRWDPQQQSGHGAENRGSLHKSKKRKRNNQNYEDSFEPVEDYTAPRGGQRTVFDVETYPETEDTKDISEEHGLFARNMSDENLKAANDQLLRETEETYRDAHETSDALEDLPRLPEDVSACPTLNHAAFSVGTIIAFKQLDMSSETNWQPRISDYRTALIDSVLDDGTLSMRMASRDRVRRLKQYNQDTGERLYSKFEMPGFNDDEGDENNGLLELAFDDLIEPKLVRPPPEEPRFSQIEKPSAGAEINGEGGLDGSGHQVTRDDQSLSLSNDSAQRVLQDVRDPRKDAEVTEQVRREIHDLIRDAGWRSSVQSKGSTQHDVPDASHIDHGQEMDPGQQTFEAPQDVPYDNPASPRFNGFSSSPPADEFHEAANQVIYPTLREASSPGPYDATASDPDRTMADTSSQADREAMQAIREDFEKELRRPAAPHQASDPPLQFSDDGSIIPPGTSPKQESISPPPTNSIHNTIRDSQPPKPAVDRNSQFLDNVSLNLKNNHSSSDNDDDDLPDLDTAFTSFSSQRAAAAAADDDDDIKPEHHSSSSDEAFMRTLPSYRSTKPNHNKPPSSSAPARSSNISKKSVAGRSKKKKEGAGARPNRYEAAPRSSQDWIGTQVVDLTLSSDPAALMMEEEQKEEEEEEVGNGGGGGGGLPRGPGWVSKHKGGKGRAKAGR